jgi:uncharacterized protein YecT (DUF1311 family)
MKKLIVLIGLLVAFSASAKEKDCAEDAENMGQFRACLFEQSNAPVQSAYNDLIKKLNGNNDAIEWIKKSQDSWESFRDNTCVFVLIISGATDDARLDCQVEFNKARIKILNQYAKQAKAK